MSEPVCARCKAEPGSFFWMGSHACKACYLEALEKWKRGVGQILEAVERGLMPKWAAEKDLDAVSVSSDWRLQESRS